MVDVAKVFGPGVPESFRHGEQAAQMTPQSPFSPGLPIGPYDGYDRTPRTRDFITGYNIATRPRTNERVSFEALTGLVTAYDVALICIWHRIDSLRSLRWKLLAADWYHGDVTDAIPHAVRVLRSPNRINGFKSWLGMWLFDVLAYDAGTLYRLRNRRGECVGLQPADGRTFAPLLDYWGNPPAAAYPGDPEPEAYVQYVNGLPWNWLTRSDLVYEPFRQVNGSIYGQPPIESIMLNANTDLRFQLYFIQKFTEGNLPAAFASAPETWGPDQIERFQNYWDGFMYGSANQGRKHQIRWIPGGSKFAWSNEKDFSDEFSMYLARKTMAAYHVVPSDLGFTEDVNRSSGESQADVQHRIGDLPLQEFAEEILSRFIYDDLKLPLKIEFDRGEEQEDQLNQAQSDDLYVKNGTISPTDLRRLRFGLEEPEGRPVPRFIYTERSGPVPLSALYAVAGPVDQETAAPDPHYPLPETAFTEVQGVLTNPPVLDMPLAEHEFGPSALPPAPPMQPPGTVVPSSQAPAQPVTKDGAPAAGITTATGITSYDLIGANEHDEETAGLNPPDDVVKAELAAFRRFTAARKRQGTWRDFRFTAIGGTGAHNLNDSGRLAVRKAAGEIAVAGLAVKAADTGRVLMLQRALTDDDPAAGCLEFAGGHIEGDESPLQAATREWQEETGSTFPAGELTGQWDAGNGIYRGFVWTCESESYVPVRGDSQVTNPDDPDGDQVEAIMWLDPAQLPGNPMLRPELAADLPLVMAALGCEPDPVVKAVPKSKADEVFHQLTEDYPKSSLEWVHHAAWEGPQVIPFGELNMRDRDHWRASHEPERVQQFADRIEKRREKGKSQLKKPAVVVFAPGESKGLVVDGHHRLLGAEKAGEPGVLAWKGHVATKTGPWDELHDVQFTQPGGSAHGGDDVAADQVGKSAMPPMGPHDLAPDRADASRCALCGLWNGDPVHDTAGTARGVVAKAGDVSPKAEAWPGWQYDLAAVAYWAPLITAALVAAFGEDRLRQIAEAWLAAPHAERGDQDKRKAAAVAAAWLTSQGADASGPLAPIAAGLIADGWLIGAISAAALTRGLTPDAGPWTPGDQNAARGIVAGLGLGAALAAALAGAKVAAAAAAISGAVMLALGRALRDGAEAGLTAAQLAAKLAAVIADPDLAARLASDAITQASGEAALEEYEQQGVDEGIWATAEDDRVCVVCELNAAEGPVPVGHPYPSGDVSPPAHGGCRCALIRVPRA